MQPLMLRPANRDNGIPISTPLMQDADETPILPKADGDSLSINRTWTSQQDPHEQTAHLSQATFKRIAVVYFNDKRGIVDEYMTFLLKEVREFANSIVFVSRGALSKKSEVAVKPLVDKLLLAEGEGLNLHGYRDGLKIIGFDELNAFDEIVLFDNTIFGPMFPFEELFKTMATRACDLWGITARNLPDANRSNEASVSPSSYLPSHFIVIRRQLAVSTAFRDYWLSLDPSCTGADHELMFTKYFEKLGYVHSAYVDPKSYGSDYPALANVDETIRDRCPILERGIFLRDPVYHEENAIDLPRALAIIERNSSYDVALIWKHIIRLGQLRDLNTTACLMSIFPDVRLQPDDIPGDYGRVAVCIHVYYTDMLEELLSYADNIPVPYDLIATTDTQAKKEEIELLVKGRPRIKKAIVLIVEENRGRDMSSLFVTCRDLFLDDRYDIVCRLHTKKTPQVVASQSNLFKRHMFDNLLASPGYVSNVLDMFNRSPWIGVAMPPIVQISFCTIGHSWYNNYSKTEEIKKRLNLEVDFDPHTPVAPYGTMFWFRPPALKKLFLHQWNMTEFNAEPHHVDGGLSHALERIIAYVAQDASYTTQHIMNARLAAWNYTMLELKLDRLLSKLPFAHTRYTQDILTQWQKLGYPLRPTLPIQKQITSVRRSLGDLRNSVSESIKYRTKKLRTGLRP
jgi:rhamnosyltransferase